MILYNVTVKIENNVQEDWLRWMKEVHIPEVMATNCFIENKIMRLLDPPADEQGPMPFNISAKTWKRCDIIGRSLHPPCKKSIGSDTKINLSRSEL